MQICKKVFLVKLRHRSAPTQARHRHGTVPMPSRLNQIITK
jgi:hypothetical protein